MVSNLHAQSCREIDLLPQLCSSSVHAGAELRVPHLEYLGTCKYVNDAKLRYPGKDHVQADSALPISCLSFALGDC